MKVTSVEFEMKLESSHQAVIDDPIGTVLQCMQQVRNKLPILMHDAVVLRDANGNRIGRAYLIIEEADEEPEADAA